jgi:branched-chain amino acid transport system ATP-binding protein
MKLKEIRKNMGVTFFIVEHRVELLMEHVDRVHVMHQGKIIAEGEPSDIINNDDVIKVYLGSI